MGKIDAKLVKQLRDATKAGMSTCKEALEANDGDIEKAKDWLRKHNKLKADSISGRTTAEGRVFTYLHHNKKIGVLLEAGTETDFVAINEDFVNLFEGVALHIAASNPKYLSREDVPKEEIERERAIYQEQVKDKPENIQSKIIDGQFEKYYQTNCLLDQKFVRDESTTVGDAIKGMAGTIGENIHVRRFQRFEIGN